MNFKGTKHDDNLVGTSGDDRFNMAQGGDDTVSAGDGDDTIAFGKWLNSADHVDGGIGHDTVILAGDYTGANALVLAADTLVNVEQLGLRAGFSYDVTTNDATVAAGQYLFVNGSALKVHDTLVFDGSAETDGMFNVDAGAGDDHIFMGAAFTTADLFDGGKGEDTFALAGDYSGAHALTFGVGTIRNFETVTLGAGFDYDLTFKYLDLEHRAFTLDGHALGAGDSLTVDMSDVRYSPISIVAGAGDDALIGSTNVINTFDLSEGGNDSATGGKATDIFKLGAALTADDHIDGGLGSNTLELAGDYSSGLVLGGAAIENIQTVQLYGAFSYDLSFDDDMVASGRTFTLDASGATAGSHVTIDASAESDGAYTMLAGAGDNTLTGGAKNDFFQFARDFGPGDSVDGGAGADTLSLGQTSGAVLSGDNVVNVEVVKFAGISDVTVTGNFSALLDATATAQMTADLSGLTHTSSFKGGNGDDLVAFGAAYQPGDFVDGGAGHDTITFDAPSATMTLGALIGNVEEIVLKGASSSYDVTLNYFADIGATVTVDASALTDSSGSLHLDASQMYVNPVHAIGGAGDDVLTSGGNFDTLMGGAGDDVLTGGMRGDILTGGAGSDIFVYANAQDSNAPATNYDHVTDFDANADFFDLGFAVTYNGETSGSVGRPAMDLAAIVNPLMTVDGAVLVDVTGGKLHGHLLLAVDADHDGAFTNADYVIDMTGMTNQASFGSGDFVI